MQVNRSISPDAEVFTIAVRFRTTQKRSIVYTHGRGFVGETVRADMRRTVRRLLTKYGYPPDAQEAATRLVIRQAELMAEVPFK